MPPSTLPLTNFHAELDDYKEITFYYYFTPFVLDGDDDSDDGEVDDGEVDDGEVDDGGGKSLTCVASVWRRPSHHIRKYSRILLSSSSSSWSPSSDRDSKCYIFEKQGLQGYQIWHSDRSNSQLLLVNQTRPDQTSGHTI